jgi:hypothetical protein
MGGKLVRNTSDKKWRVWWEAVYAAASKAPSLRYEEDRTQRETRSRSSSKESPKKRKALPPTSSP